MSAKPNVLILGGLMSCSRSLASFLVPESGEPLVSSLSIYDKYTVNPPTTYLGAAFKKTLESPLVHYKQANLSIPAAVQQAFEPPEGQEPFRYVFDCTGEMTYDRPDVIQRDNTAKVAYYIGTEAARRGVAAYVRLTMPYYETSLEKKLSDEKDNPKPQGVRGAWWHEALRMLAGIQNLNLVILRASCIYGPYNLAGLVTPRITIGRVYKHLNEEMKYLWSPDIHMNTVHVDDVSGAMWAAAEWMAPLGREQANNVAGEVIHYFPPTQKDLVAELEGHLPKGSDPVAPLFNITDDSNSTANSMGQVVAKVFDIKFGFYGFVVNTKVKMDYDSMVEDINEKHMQAWTEIILKANPPVPNTPITAWIDGHMLAKYSVAYTGDKIKRVVGYQLTKPQFNVESVQEIIDLFKAEGTWPNLED
ncbi:hypothetical protein FRC03_005359 [Tulasnella sp. 419]|nr:hypothetical protein FRC02_001587 [Tulasnella sp. 418]KAG8961470.1 hypothetical protein FRC03_005359 [Tulasnella sp. 419]